ncbi:hypothetical protein GAGA_1383 [Paraglaciecola agarilytica NO2]|uniref:Uncharacterized protein n=1 Tax=Paraglaciecola agarilytica NO2 TaxID=1125747 RepID=A0ABQ0I4H6_9ALTE|nr:hypothetical protein GAGA_1383 [Paraglaciecola agarilytica NO2]
MSLKKLADFRFASFLLLTMTESECRLAKLTSFLRNRFS